TNVVLGAMDIEVISTSADISQFGVSVSGTAPFDAIRVYYDIDNSGTLSTGDIQLGIDTTFSNGRIFPATSGVGYSAIILGANFGSAIPGAFIPTGGAMRV